jgi:hypothetical protein
MLDNKRELTLADELDEDIKEIENTENTENKKEDLGEIFV